jgi:hypothetical protein
VVLQAPCTSHLSQTLINITNTHDIRYHLCIIPFAVSKLYGTERRKQSLVLHELMKPIMMFMLMSTEFKKIVASIKEDNTDHLARKCRADSAVTRRAAARWRPKQPGAAAGTRAARAPVCSLPRPYPFNNPPTRASDDERPRRMKVGRWQTRARYSDLWKQRSIMSPLGLQPAADSCLHGSAALRNQQVQSLPQPPLYRDARHRKQATSSSPAGSAVLLSSGRV